MKNSVYSLLLSIVLFGCGDFLDEQSQDKSYVTSYVDLDEILVGQGYMKTAGGISLALDDLLMPWLAVMDDDVQEVRLASGGDALDRLGNFYSWGQYPFTSEGGVVIKDGDWSKLYEHINIANVILSQVDLFPGDPVEERTRIKGECYFLRAHCYFMLVNSYAKPYAKESAGKDLGVPIKLTEYIEDIHYTRNSVAEVYEQIVDDLKEAARCLEGKSAKLRGKHQAGEAATRALLARVYLYMGEYALSLEQSTHPIFDSYALQDMNAFTSSGGFLLSTSPEIIFSQGAYNAGKMHSAGFAVSESLMAAYGVDDLRGTYFFDVDGRRHSKYIIAKAPASGYNETVSDVMGLRLGEVLLNRAEAYALSEQPEKALDVLKVLRQNRYKKGTTLVNESLTGKALVDEIRKERRLELCFEGHRWFDLRRYAVHPTYPHSEPVYHDRFERSGRTEVYVGYYELKPYGGELAYVLPLPDYALIFNEGALVDNEERVERVLIEKPRN